MKTNIRSFADFSPKISEKAFIDPTALVIGNVIIEEDCSIWPMTVIRGDIHKINIGYGTNIQDLSVLHVTHDSHFNPGGHALIIGKMNTIGHRVILHGCMIKDFCLIGMGSSVLDGAIINDKVIIGANSLVPPGKELESGYLWVGSPVRKIRELKKEELEFLEYSAQHYIKLKNQHLSEINVD